MSEESNRSESEAEVEREIREARKFTPQEALARMAGPGAMKGGSPISRQQEAENAIGAWLATHLADTPGALRVVVRRHLNESELLLANLDQPLVAVADYCRRVLSSDYLLKELVREADVEWGEMMGERPYFEREGSQPHSSDPYRVERVRETLTGLVQQLGG